LCKKLHELKGKRPKCEECMPTLQKENEMVLNLFLLVKDQNVMAGETPVALNLAVARTEIERLIKDKDDQDVAISRILAAHRSMLNLINEQRREKLEEMKHR